MRPSPNWAPTWSSPAGTRQKCAAKCEEIVRQTGGSIRAVGLELDLLKKDASRHFLDEVHKHFGAIDILVNNAWSGNKNSWESISEEHWEYDINMSLNSVFRLTKAAFPDLKETRGLFSISPRCTGTSGRTIEFTMARNLRIHQVMVQPRPA